MRRTTSKNWFRTIIVTAVCDCGWGQTARIHKARIDDINNRQSSIEFKLFEGHRAFQRTFIKKENYNEMVEFQYFFRVFTELLLETRNVFHWNCKRSCQTQSNLYIKEMLIK